MTQFSYFQTIPLPYIFFIIFTLIILSYVLGFRVKKIQIHRSEENSKIDISTLNGTLLGLLALLLAFTFNMASSRFDSKRELVINEANDIGTAYLRSQLYPDSTKKILQGYFKEYVDERIAYHEAGIDLKKVFDHYDRANVISNKIWMVVTNDTKKNNMITRSGVMVPAVNSMIDVAQTRRASEEEKVPDSILYLLLLLCFSSAFLLGYDNKVKIDWIVLFGIAFMLSATIYTILDLDRTRQGMIGLDKGNEKMIQLRTLIIEDKTLN